MTDVETTDAAVLDLADVRAGSGELVGGKAANLAELIGAGFPVPDGFCVTTAAYRSAVAGAVDEEGRPLGEARPPMSLVRQIEAAYDRLGDGVPVPVAVRSSSTAEDLPDASFAGQYDTFLDVRGIDDVLAAVRKCWASLWSDRAVRYRGEQSSAYDEPMIAVVVQRMVDATCAGMLFTADPISGKRDETVIEAATGLGEAVVSGTVTPDRYRVRADGSCDVAVDGCLSTGQVTELSALGAALRRHFGAPQDVEWAIDGSGRVWLTQSRPITSLFPVPASADGEPRAYWSVHTYQGIGRPFTPMGAHLIRHRQRSMRHTMTVNGFSEELVEQDGWLFWDITEGVRHPVKRDRMAAFVDAFGAADGQVVKELGQDPRFAARETATPAAPYRRRRPWLRIVASWLWPNLARRLVHRRARRQVGRLAGPIEASARERFEYVDRTQTAIARIETDLPRGANTAGGLAQQLATRLLGDRIEPAELQAVFRGVEHNPTMEMDLRLWRLSTLIRADQDAFGELLRTAPGRLAAKYRAGALPEVVQRGVTDFLASYGCRATAEIDFGVPRWSDDPEPVFAMLTNFLRAEDPDQDARRRFRDAAAEANEQIRCLVRRLPPARGLLVGFLLRRSRALRGLREFGKLYLMRGVAQLRHQLLLIGDDLVRAGRLTERGEVMFLDVPEVGEALDGRDFRAVVAERRASYDRESRRRNVPSIILSDGTIPAPRPTIATADGSGHTELIGVAAAAGHATGIARVVHEPDGAEIRPGEILVAPSTDPGWTPLFLTAAALVTETGGMTSHGTTVAREYGIPAVVGLPEATRLIRTGQLITVDGSSGIVSLAGGDDVVECRGDGQH